MKRPALVMAAIVLTAAWCFAGEVPLIADPVVAPATGTVTYQRHGNQTQLSLKVADLKPASQLKPSPRKVYVVWLEESNKQWRNLGTLQVNGKHAALTATVPTGNMFVLVTAENNAHGNNPSGPEVMQATVLGQ
jgi:hypothetical protein